MADLIQIRTDSLAIFELVNPILAQAEPAFENDTGAMRIGDGIRSYSDLPVYLPYKFITRVDYDALLIKENILYLFI